MCTEHFIQQGRWVWSTFQNACYIREILLRLIVNFRKKISTFQQLKLLYLGIEWYLWTSVVFTCLVSFPVFPLPCIISSINNESFHIFLDIYIYIHLIIRNRDRGKKLDVINHRVKKTFGKPWNIWVFYLGLFADLKFERKKKNLELNHRLDTQDGVIEAMRIAFLFKKGGRKSFVLKRGDF